MMVGVKAYSEAGFDSHAPAVFRWSKCVQGAELDRGDASPRPYAGIFTQHASVCVWLCGDLQGSSVKLSDCEFLREAWEEGF